MNLFGETAPLAYRMAPRTLDEYQGQEHLLGIHKPLRTMIEKKMVQSMIFFGPPACGKTGLAKMIAQYINAEYINVNALTLSSEEIKQLHAKAVENQNYSKKTVLFIDEIHRLTKPKQDAFLSSIESGLIVLIGATTENPYFSLQNALRSRVLIFEFFALTYHQKKNILDRALAQDLILKKLNIILDSDAEEFLLDYSSDPRNMLTILETAIISQPVGSSSISKTYLETIIQKSDTLYNSKDMHYDVISAFIKSVRGSDPDAALYYLGIMIQSGEDPKFIFRRLMILAVEDIGMAYPDAINVIVSCASAFEQTGFPEGSLFLSHATLYLAGLPKSNSVLAIHDVFKDLENGVHLSVPDYLRDSSHFRTSKLSKKYEYPHNFPNHFVKQKYTSSPVSYYKPSQEGFENKMLNRLIRLWGDDKKYPL